MSKLKLFVLSFSALFFILLPNIAKAGGGPVEFNIEPLASSNVPSSYLNPGEQFTIHARVYAEGLSYPTYCKGCYIKFGLENPQASDVLEQSSDKTDENGYVDAKVISKVPGKRMLIVQELRNNNGAKVTANSYAMLYYKGETMSTPIPTSYPMPGAPEMVYPSDSQVLGIDGAYMFKVKPVAGASGYLFGFFQNDIMIYENYRDDRTLSSNGEFAVWESNPFHVKFQLGKVKVLIRALVNNQWTDAREITITLAPGGGTSNQPPSPVIPNTNQLVSTTKFPPPNIQPSQKIVVVTDSSASAALQQRINDLEKKLAASERRQSVLESQLNQLITWIKSIFPFFKR